MLRVYGEHFELGAEPGTASDTNYDLAKIFVGGKMLLYNNH